MKRCQVLHFVKPPMSWNSPTPLYSSVFIVFVYNSLLPMLCKSSSSTGGTLHRLYPLGKYYAWVELNHHAANSLRRRLDNPHRILWSYIENTLSGLKWVEWLERNGSDWHIYTHYRQDRKCLIAKLSIDLFCWTEHVPTGVSAPPCCSTWFVFCCLSILTQFEKLLFLVSLRKKVNAQDMKDICVYFFK